MGSRGSSCREEDGARSLMVTSEVVGERITRLGSRAGTSLRALVTTAVLRSSISVGTHSTVRSNQCPRSPQWQAPRCSAIGLARSAKCAPPHTHTHARACTHTHKHFLTPVAGGNDSDATAEAIATCAGIAPFNSLQG